MVTFFILLAVLMVLVVAATQWFTGPRRRIHFEDDEPIVIDRRHVTDRDPLYMQHGRRVVRRTRVY